MNSRPQAAPVIQERGAAGRRRGREDAKRNYLASLPELKVKLRSQPVSVQLSGCQCEF